MTSILNKAGMLKKAGLGLVLAATALTAAAPAEAQRYGGRGYGHGGYRGHDNGGAVVAGIAGLAIGAAIASSANDRYRDRYYDDRGYSRNYDYNYYSDHGYYPDDGYYAYSYRSRYPHCYVEQRWDGYYGRNVRVRVCR